MIKFQKALLLSLLAAESAVNVAAAALAEGTTHTVQLGSSDTITTLKEADGLGDVFTWDRSNKIYKTDDPAGLADAEVLGDNQGHCIRLTNEGDSSEWDCIFAIFFEDGQLHVHGPFNAGETVTSIVGGTGAYSGASGSMTLSFAGTHDADGTVSDDGAFFSYNYIFDLKLGSGEGAPASEGGAEGDDASGGRRLAQCGTPSVMSAIKMGVLGSIPFW